MTISPLICAWLAVLTLFLGFAIGWVGRKRSDAEACKEERRFYEKCGQQYIERFVTADGRRLRRRNGGGIITNWEPDLLE